MKIPFSEMGTTVKDKVGVESGGRRACLTILNLGCLLVVREDLPSGPLGI